MAELLLEYSEPVESESGKCYTARACGSDMGNGTWQGWIEFVPHSGGEPIRSARETTQPNRQDTLYWATGLTPVFLEGSLRRAMKPLVRPAAPRTEPPYFDGPAEPSVAATNGAEAVLDPFSVYRKGEALLRRQLSALADWHLVNIIRKYNLSDASDAGLGGLRSAQLVELIVAAVARR